MLGTAFGLRFATGPNYSDIPDLLAMHPLPDGNVIYIFHFYDPHVFTHQGATWGVPWWSYEHGIPYPPRPTPCSRSSSKSPIWPTATISKTSGSITGTPNASAPSSTKPLTGASSTTFPALQ